MSLRASSSIAERCGTCDTSESISEGKEVEVEVAKPEGDGDRPGEGEIECAAVTRGAVVG